MLYFPQCILCSGIHTVGRGAIIIALTNASLPAKRRILTTCVKLFLEQGYKKTTVAEIISGADVSCSSFQNRNTFEIELLLSAVISMVSAVVRSS